MPSIVNTHEAKTHLSKLLERVRRGEEIIIARSGKPIARLVPVEEEQKGPRVLGQLAGLAELLPGWDEPLYTEEEMASWPSGFDEAEEQH